MGCLLGARPGAASGCGRKAPELDRDASATQRRRSKIMSKCTIKRGTARRAGPTRSPDDHPFFAPIDSGGVNGDREPSAENVRPL